MKYIIRLDDICPQMNWDNFWRAKEIFIKHKINPLIGVIPDNKDFKYGNQPLSIFRKEIDILIREGWEIAQHGHTHELKQNGGILELHPHGEFPGLSESQQFMKLKKGKEILESYGWKIDYFFPPAHAYDRTTLKILKYMKFKAILDGIGIYPWIDEEKLLHIPQIWWRPIQLPRPLRKINGTIIICLHPNNMNDKDFKQLDFFLKKHKNKITNVKKTIEKFRKKRTDITVRKKMNEIAKLMFYTIKKVK